MNWPYLVTLGQAYVAEVVLMKFIASNYRTITIIELFKGYANNEEALKDGCIQMNETLSLESSSHFGQPCLETCWLLTRYPFEVTYVCLVGTR